MVMVKKQTKHTLLSKVCEEVLLCIQNATATLFFRKPLQYTAVKNDCATILSGAIWNLSGTRSHYKHFKDSM